MPKERKRRSFDSSDDGMSSDEDLFNKKIPPLTTKGETTKEKSGRKGRPPKPEGTTARKRSKQKEPQEQLVKQEKEGKNKLFNYVLQLL